MRKLVSLYLSSKWTGAVRISVFTCIIVLAVNGYGQSTGLNSASGYEQRGLGIYTMNNNSDSANAIEGSTYLFPDWKTNAVVSTKNGKKYKISGLNYDAKLDKLVSKVGKDSLFSFNPATIAEARINSKTFKRYLDPEFKRNSFYEVILTKENVELLKRINIAVKKGYVNALTKIQETPDSYTLKDSYFVKEEDVVRRISSKKKHFMKMFGDKSGSIKEYVKENRLSIKRESDLIDIFTYYDSL